MFISAFREGVDKSILPVIVIHMKREEMAYADPSILVTIVAALISRDFVKTCDSRDM
jgi:hypothetical protein